MRRLGFSTMRAVLTLLLLGAAPGLVAQQAPAAAPAVRLSGYLQARETWREKAGLTATINRARLTASGSVATGFSWRIQGEFRTGNVGTGRASVALTDAYIRYKSGAFGVQAGQFKTPFSREYWTSLSDLETADRSTVVDSLSPKRDIGVMADYDLHRRVQLYAGLFNGEGTNLTVNRDSTALGVARVVVRLHPHVTLGANAVRYFGDSTRYGADLSYEDRRLTLRAEALAGARDSVGGKHDKGWFALAGFKVREPVQLVVRYEHFERPEFGSAQDNSAWTGAVNVFLAGNAVRLTGEYIHREIGDPGQETDMLLGQLQVKF